MIPCTFYGQQKSKVVVFNDSGLGLEKPWTNNNICTASIFIRKSRLIQIAREPAVYTKISCFLPWIAKQYGMHFTENVEDYRNECSKGTGDDTDFNAEQCRSNSDQESFCIFPFYWNGRLHDECVFLEEQEFLFPVYRCPIRNITRKIDGVNSFIYSDLNAQVDIERKCESLIQGLSSI